MSRFSETPTLMTCPTWSIARYRQTHRPATFTYVSSANQRSPGACRHGRAASIDNGVKRCTHRKTVTWSTVIPRSASSSFTSRQESPSAGTIAPPP